MIDFYKLLKDYNIKYINATKNYININCPLGHSNGSRGFKGGFNLETGQFHCWVCGSSPTGKVLSKLLQVNYFEAKKILEQYSTNISTRTLLNKKKAKGTVVKLVGDDIEPGSRAWRYLVNRRFDPKLLMYTYNIKDGGIVGDWAFRIIIPILYNERIVSLQGRSLFSKGQCEKLDILRYKFLPISSSIIDPKKILYNIDNCKENWVVVTEGVFDCWRLGPRNVLASMGTSMSNEQILLLATRYKKVIFLFDNETEAQDRARRYGYRLAGLGCDVEIFNPEYEHDPGAYSEEEESEVRHELRLN